MAVVFPFAIIVKKMLENVILIYPFIQMFFIVNDIWFINICDYLD